MPVSRFEPAKGGSIFLIAILAAAIVLLLSGETSWWARVLVALLLGAFIVWIAIGLIPGLDYLELDSDGFVVSANGRKTRRLWKHCSRFEIRRVSIGEDFEDRLTYFYDGAPLVGLQIWGLGKSRYAVDRERRTFWGRGNKLDREFEILYGNYSIGLAELVRQMNERRREALARDGGADV